MGCHRPASADVGPNLPQFEEDAMLDPIAIFEDEQEEYLKLCTALEEIADSLLGNIDFIIAEEAVSLLREGFANHIFCQQELLFPLIRKRAEPLDNIDVLLSQLEYEHAVDQGLAVEVSEALADLVEQRRVENPEMLGYLLRCFFEGYRRHSSWEKNVIYPICRKRLTKEDSSDLAQCLASAGKLPPTLQS